MRSSKGFNVEVVCRHLKYMPGEKLYIKACAWRYSEPTMYKILSRDTGEAIGYIDGNEFRNRFKECCA